MDCYHGLETYRCLFAQGNCNYYAQISSNMDVYSAVSVVFLHFLSVSSTTQKFLINFHKHFSRVDVYVGYYLPLHFF